MADVDAARAAVDAAEAKVEKLTGHLAGAKSGVTEARKALAAAEKEGPDPVAAGGEQVTVHPDTAAGNGSIQ